jgi:hypothetical protein
MTPVTSAFLFNVVTPSEFDFSTDREGITSGVKPVSGLCLLIVLFGIYL